MSGVKQSEGVKKGNRPESKLSGHSSKMAAIGLKADGGNENELFGNYNDLNFSGTTMI
jgi:hypothetical protein